ncbi:MAG TPA: mycothiol system anti-sigma-R factor [Chloroflexota bacterium]|nr:mycothiol system anti-sigma-R factor [Chloroflexota bacterium]
MINCTYCLQALHPYLDRELSDDDIAQVREHLDACAGCLHQFQFEESLRRLVRVRCQEQQAPDGLRAKVEARLTIERTRLLKKT